MIKFSRNNLKYQNVRSPPEHTANGNVHADILLGTGYYCIRTCHSKQFSVGLMVLGLVYFLEIEKKNCRTHQNYLVALNNVSGKV